MLWFVCGALVVVLAIALVERRGRRRFRESGEAFRCRLRARGPRSPLWPTLGRRWSRPMWAVWDGDVLVVRRGVGAGRVIPLRTQSPVDGVRRLLLDAPRRCGARPIGVVLRLWDGSRIDVAADHADRTTVVGPYLTAAISDLPQAPAPRRPR